MHVNICTNGFVVVLGKYGRDKFYEVKNNTINGITVLITPNFETNLRYVVYGDEILYVNSFSIMESLHGTAHGITYEEGTFNHYIHDVRVELESPISKQTELYHHRISRT